MGRERGSEGRYLVEPRDSGQEKIREVSKGRESESGAARDKGVSTLACGFADVARAVEGVECVVRVA